MKANDLSEWSVIDPDNRQDHLPQPYRLIDQILKQTILHKLSLSMYQIEQKKKDKNYEGTTTQYHSQNTIDIENIACLSATSKHHNYLMAGDKSGCLYLLDLPKKIVFSKKELCSGRRTLYISETSITDGDIFITVSAAIFNNHNKIYILRYKYSEPKVQLAHVIEVCPDQSDPNKLPYACHFEDYGRLLCVFTFDGNIHFYRIPEIGIDLDQINRGQTIPLEEEEFKKRLRYPFTYAQLEAEVTNSKQPVLTIKFQGKKIPLTRQQLLVRMAKKVQAPPAQVADPKKDPKKKQEKKEQQIQPLKQNFEFNATLNKSQLLIQNGQDNTSSYPLPKFRPFVYFLHRKVQLQKKKQFQKGRLVEIPQNIIFGWANTNQIRFSPFLSTKTNHYPDYLYIQHFLQRIPQTFKKQKQTEIAKQITISKKEGLKNISDITATALSLPGQSYLAVGMKNGAISVWNTYGHNILFNADIHQGAVTVLEFFEGWKLISGSRKGQIHIDNIISSANQIKRTNVFQSKIDLPITDLKVLDLGIAYALDSGANLRVYDLWRNQKICRMASCTHFSLLENKGKRWLPSDHIQPANTLYINNDFAVILSNNWSHYSLRQLEESPQKQAQINSLIQNPWKGKGSNVHVVRNFEFLLHLFEGLQNIYKKGYERKKVQNLFSNLQFAQLHDRSFDIPDFGVTANKKGDRTQVYFGSASRSHLSSKSKEKRLKESNSISQVSLKSKAKDKLTNEVLHPQKFLLQRRKIQRVQVLSDQRLREAVRDMYKKQSALQNMLNSDLSKGLL